MANINVSDYVLLAEASYADFSLSISALRATKSSLHFINGAES